MYRRKGSLWVEAPYTPYNPCGISHMIQWSFVQNTWKRSDSHGFAQSPAVIGEPKHPSAAAFTVIMSMYKSDIDVITVDICNLSENRINFL